MEKKIRALRRHHRQRRIQAEYKKWSNSWGRYQDEDWLKRTAICHADIRTPRSCAMCGNQRNHFGTQSLAEAKEEHNTREQFEEQGFYFKNRFRNY